MNVEGANDAVAASDVIHALMPTIISTKKRLNPFDYENPSNVGPRPDQVLPS